MSRRRHAAALAGLLGGTALLLGACGGDDEPTATPAPVATDAAPGPAESTDAAAPATDPAPGESALPPAGEGGALTISDFTFSPLTATAGAEISISNLDGFAHTVTSDDFDIRVEGGATETLTIDAAGTYAIICKLHPMMSGTIVVE
jgi:plastocyanin